METRRDTANGLQSDAEAAPDKESDREAVRGAHIKWLIFGVFIPLLPVGARLAAAWLDGRGATFKFTTLFGDGELLVLATVVAAASIGEVLFSFRRDPLGINRLRTAIVTAAALVVVVLSVLFFGLVTYAKQTQGDAQTVAQQRQQGVARRLVSEASSRSAEARTEASNARKIEDMFIREVRGTPGRGSSGAAGEGPLAARLEAEIRASQQQRVRLEHAASQLTRQAEQAQTGQETSESDLALSRAELHSGRLQAAEISVAMFIASLLVAFPAVSLGAREQHDSVAVRSKPFRTPQNASRL